MKTNSYRFKPIMKIKDPLRVFFLCGTKFGKNDSNDKRNVLKSFIESNYNKHYKAIILEEHFIFGNPKKNYLSYDSIFMKNLKDVELITGLYSDKIFIIHESISTAAELGMFASDKNLLKKTCLITPDSFSMEEDKISSFIRLAFFNDRSAEDKIKNIVFYPKVQERIVSKSKIDYYTYFPKNKIHKSLALNIDNFIKEDNDEEFEIRFKKNKFHKSFEDENIISYFFNETELNVFFSPKVIRILLISLFSLPDLKNEIRKCSSIIKTVSTLQHNFTLILMNSISEIEATDFSKYRVNITLDQNELNIRLVIGYFLYLLQALNMVKLPAMKSNKTVGFTTESGTFFKKYVEIIEEIHPSKLTGLL
ncbi:hypothetical protein OWP15_11570 [Bacillus paranthracis]|uniref:hypothetical protein n=1 Tax=Bacillus paranthracis TaxID=2026186 RepID=UPI000789F9F0|nr:hypothetical protein [Bacillus paranthracis]KYQ01863.1 hypothetical protein B4079_3145 [Bacillus cereus]MDK7473353.1 hypothetical protein [Bacillus paranthracis]